MFCGAAAHSVPLCNDLVDLGKITVRRPGPIYISISRIALNLYWMLLNSFFLLYRFIESFLLCCLCFLKKWQIYSKASIIGGMTQSVWERDVCGFRGTKLDMQAGWEVVSQSPFDTNVQYKAFLSHRNSSSTELHSDITCNSTLKVSPVMSCKTSIFFCQCDSIQN